MSRGRLLRKFCAAPPALLKRTSLGELIRVYHDLEKTLKGLKNRYDKSALESSLRAINIRKLILQLSLSKRKLGRKIGNTLLLEKRHLQRKIHHFVGRSAKS